MEVGYLEKIIWKTFIPNFSFLGRLEVAQIYFPQGGVCGWVGGEGNNQD